MTELIVTLGDLVIELPPSSGFSLWGGPKAIEPVGRHFELVWKKVHRGEIEIIGLDEQQDESEDSGEDNENDETLDELREKYQKKQKQWAAGAEQDHYEVMGLGDLRWRATDNDIKQAYKKMILIVHPDKNTGGSDEAFKMLQKSYDVLSNAKKRRAYDSQEPFDDDLPTASEVEKGDFFEVFDSVFEMNSRWSSIQPAPKLGDMKTTYEQTVKFYNFWWAFKSWRDFTFDDDYELDQAGSREEKRWMERENEKKRNKKRKEEAARIQDLANMAYKKDPRIQNKLKEEEDKKNKVKEAKLEAKRKAQEAIENAERAEREKKEEEERKKKEEAEAKKAEKKRLDKEIKDSKENFRNLCYNSIDPKQVPRIEDVELIVANLGHMQLNEISQEMKQSTDMKSVFDSHFEQVKSKIAGKEQAAKDTKKAKDQEDSNDKMWTDEECHQLAKAFQKYPVGVPNRWEMVAAMVPTRTVKEVIAKSKTAQPTKAFTKPAAIQTGNAYEKLKSKVGEKVIKSELSTRPEPLPDTVVVVEAPKSTTTSTTAAAKPAAKKSAEKAEAVWTPEEQKLLEEALSTIDKSLEDRWDRIAAKVGKSKKDCVARYKYLVNLVKQQAK
ncbi:hypothetical protein CYY_002218 [Polysphondylium violaceum]|uniref:Myb domain-containing protein n=1 Tax=Polysphondylium violaceum TaxID=133409 RepID=A0A8J4PYF6_9MYCE|nr:hypothetical protein CYY_002218 [Polysphondylium violaceum]